MGHWERASHFNCNRDVTVAPRDTWIVVAIPAQRSLHIEFYIYICMYIYIYMYMHAYNMPLSAI